MDRQKYYDAVKSQLETNIFYHSLALEACMGGLYDYLLTNNGLTDNEPKKEDWMLAGLIHDIDYSGEFKATHPQKTVEALAKYGLAISETVHNIVKAHAPSLTGRQPQNKAEWSIFCADSLTGLIVATTLVYPSKKMADVKLSSVLKRFLKEPKFAAGTRREEVKMCSKPEGLNLPIEKFIEICFESMKKIASEIGL
ncbi:phosphohydrolase [Candidatus Roizmanbacteria bacterium CG_4_10_14_0_8_um_filter_35_28]|uniref:Phosphohydrolase n=4 Tax=Candidatus Roizmaniibacteriota TaxID=1752723 RepID=A0A2G9Y724_9BACT|nr:MAG: phosphohydrolase [Candidatus Roizmanbacteria bacterium CG23_combo_of_CG06-09_8_20_14_all_35_49]PIY71002.1 MAG: phosphohydrolase [Candidatus Roizmanbacteria bacterium CG_4_10_14_0_8_um_filter_35_28]PJC82451.1 MAG: phosphohydrolase [Candidatus Roizmanbacteria bacterium CG_4_8_14_3_um_filter_35_14]